MSKDILKLLMKTLLLKYKTFFSTQRCTIYVLYFTKGFQGIKNHQKSKADTSQEHIERLNTPPHLLTLYSWVVL